MAAAGDQKVDQRPDKTTPVHAGGMVMAAPGSSMDIFSIVDVAIEVVEGPLDSL